MPVGRATIAIPINDDNILTRRPKLLTGYISPYPTVVRVTTDQYIA